MDNNGRQVVDTHNNIYHTTVVGGQRSGFDAKLSGSIESKELGESFLARTFDELRVTWLLQSQQNCAGTAAARQHRFSSKVSLLNVLVDRSFHLFPIN